MRTPTTLVLILALASFALPAAAQHDHAAAAAAPPAVLDPGLGDLHWAVSTKNAEAQRFFDQGMRYLYAFNHESAVRSFDHARELDPQLAMAAWGSALALGPNINLDVDPDREKQAYAASQQALALAANATPLERDLIAALAKRYSIAEGADLHQLSVDYSEAMRTVAKSYPSDPNVNTLFAESLMDLRPWKFWSHDGKPAEGTEEIVSTLEGVLRQHPHHMGANHYYIHAVEASMHPVRALASAKRLETLAPSAGHLVHMPAHIFQRTGDYAGAARANERGAEPDRKYIATYGGEGMYAAMYYNHNLGFGSASHAMLGHYAKARALAAEMAANIAPMLAVMPPVEPFAAAPLLVDVRFGKWEQVLRAPVLDAGPLSTLYSHFARATAYAKSGNLPGAERERAAFDQARAALGDDPGFLQNSPKALATVAANLLDGHLAWAKGERAAAIDAYRKAVEAEDALNYNEPADWFYPTRETLGEALLSAGRRTEAMAVYHEDLKRNPGNPWTLKAMANSRR
jgi:tetratricopeptide (TPR) repeat protein